MQKGSVARMEAPALVAASGGERAVLFRLRHAQRVNAGTVKSRREECEVDGLSDSGILLRMRRERPKAQQRQKDASQDYKQANQKTEIKEG